MKKIYNMKEIAKETNLSSSTIRYYDNLNLLTDVQRDKNNYRIFTQEHVKCLNVYKKLRDIDMSILEIEYVHQKYNAGKLTNEEIDLILLNQKNRIQNEIKILNDKISLIEQIKKII